MFPPLDLIYRLTDRDQQAALWGPRYWTDTAGAAAATVTAGGTGTAAEVPPEYVFFCTNVMVYFQPGAAQNLDTGFVYVYDDANNLKGIIAGVGAAAANTVVLLNHACQIMLTDRHHLAAAGNFNAGAAANAVTLAAAGMYVPRANIALF